MDQCVSGAMQSIVGVTDVQCAFYVEKCNVENVMRFICWLVRKPYLGLKEQPSKNKKLRLSEGQTEVYSMDTVVKDSFLMAYSCILQLIIISITCHC